MKAIGTIEGLGKKGEVFSFLIGVTNNPSITFSKDVPIQINGIEVSIKDFDGEYLSFELPLEKVVDTSLANLEIGSEVTVNAVTSALPASGKVRALED